MTRTQRRLLILVATLPLLVVLFAVLYMVGMAYLEGEERSFWAALGWAAETLSTTGYGHDDFWHHPAMVLLVAFAQFIGVFLVFLVFPIYLIPFLEERFEKRVPRQARGDITDHVLVFRSGPAVETLLTQLVQRRIPALVVETDEAAARRLRERNVPVVYCDQEDDVLEVGRIDTARTLVVNGSDEEDAALTLSARQLGFEGEIIALVENPSHRQPMVLAGASTVFTPRHVLAAALAARASDRISSRLAEVQRIGGLEVREVRLAPSSSLVGTTLREAAIGERTGATVIGQWVGGELKSPPTADMRLEPRGILIVVGSSESLDRFVSLSEGAVPLRKTGHFVVAGFGEVGRKVHQLLTDAGEEVIAVDRAELPGVDLVGDVVDPAVLKRARVAEAKCVVLALDRDDLTLFATVVVKDLAPEAPVIARVNHALHVERIHRAGADFALSLAQVSAQMLARRLLGEEAVTLDPQLKLLKAEVDGLEGKHPAELGIRERTRSSVVAVEREGKVLVEFGPEFRFQAADVLYVCGSDTAVRSFRETFQTA